MGTVNEGVHIRPTTEWDLPFLVNQHLLVFQAGFFARLGHRFLYQYYRSYLNDPDAFVATAFAGEELIGYLVGVVDPARHRQHVLRGHGRFLAGEAALAMLRKPSVLLLFLRTRALRYVRRLRAARSPAGAPHGEPKCAVLSYVAVVTHSRGMGVAGRLIAEFEHRAAGAGCGRMELVTHAGGRGFTYYRRAGWTAIANRVTQDGQRLTTFTKTLGTEQATADASTHGFD